MTYRQDISEDGDENGIEIDGELLRLGLEFVNVGDLHWVGAGVAELVVGQQEEGGSGAGRQQQDQGDQDLVRQRRLLARVILGLLSGLKI